MQIDKEAITRPPEKPLKHPIRKLVISFILATVLMFFMGTISLDQYSGYLHPPTFPLSYIVTTPCLNILGYCIGSYSYSLARAVVDFALWYAAGSLGIFALIALL